MNIIIYSIAIVTICVVINIFIMSYMLFRLYQEVLNYHERYIKRLLLSEVVIEGILEGKNEQELLHFYNENQEEIEEMEK